MLMRIRLDRAAGDAGAGVAGGLALQVVGVFVDDDGAADHAGLRTVDGEFLARQLEMTLAVLVGLNVAKVAGMALGVVGARVVVVGVGGVEVGAGAGQVGFA